MKQRLHSSFPSSLKRKPSNGQLSGMTTKDSNILHSKRQGKRTVEEYLAEFRLLTSLAGMTSDTPSDNLHLINYFQRGLNPAIAKKIALSDSVPTTITEWADR